MARATPFRRYAATVASLTMLFPKVLRSLHTMPLQSAVVDCTLACEIMTEKRRKRPKWRVLMNN